MDCSVILIEILTYNEDYDEEQLEEPDEVQAAVTCREMAMKRPPDGDEVGLDIVRVGMGFCGSLQTCECFEIDLVFLQGLCALDGAYWGDSFDGQEPPPMDERRRLGEKKEDWKTLLSDSDSVTSSF